MNLLFFFSSRRRHTRFDCDWSSDVCSSDLCANWATAREGALKVKETSYLASEGFQTEQFLHGPMAEMDPRAALVVLLTGGRSEERRVGEEGRSRGSADH